MCVWPNLKYGNSKHNKIDTPPLITLHSIIHSLNKLLIFKQFVENDESPEEGGDFVILVLETRRNSCHVLKLNYPNVWKLQA